MLPTDLFTLQSFAAHNGTTVEPGLPLRGVGPEEPWSYAVSFAQRQGAPRANGPAEVVVSAQVIDGRIGIGLVAADLATYVCETEVDVDEGPAEVRLPVERLEDVAALIVRNAGRRSRPRFVVSSIAVRSRPGRRFAAPEPRLRGFRSKSSLEDQRRLLEGEATIIVDVGANVGDTAAAYRESFPTARIHALEPHPAVARGLADRFAGDHRVTPHALALGSRLGTVTLHTFQQHAMNSTLPIADAGRAFVDGPVRCDADVAVPMTTLDSFCREHAIDHIDILKIDTQGAELDVLAGAGELLSAGRVRLVLCEIVFVPVYSGQTRYFDLARHLDSQGFELYDLYDFQYNADGRLKWGDALFISRRMQ